MIKRLCLALLLIYTFTLLLYYLCSLMTVSYERREFTKKELFDGPLVMRDNVITGHGRIVQSNVLFGANMLFDQPISKDSILESDEVNATAASLPTEFFQALSSMAKDISSTTSPSSPFLFFSFVNLAFLRLTLNWLCNTSVFEGVHERVLFVASSHSVCESIREEWPEIHCLSSSLDDYDEAERWGTSKYIHLLNLRVRMMSTLTNASIPFVLFETDSVWFRDPSSFFASQTLLEDGDVIVPSKWDTHKWDKLTFDPMVVHPTMASAAFLREMDKRLSNDSSLYDQDILNELCQTQFAGVVCRQFEWTDVSDGFWFKRSDQEKSELRPYIVNNNYYVGVDNKESRQALNGLWFLTKRTRCVRSKVTRALQKYGEYSTTLKDGLEDTTTITVASGTTADD